MSPRRYVDEEGVVTLKGRVAAAIQSADELVLTELIFNSGFKVLWAAFVILQAMQQGWGLKAKPWRRS
jgi:superfamily II RNA helicase